MEERQAQGLTATDALRAAAHSCRCFLDRSPFPLAYVGLDGRVFYASPDFPRPPDAPASLDGVEFARAFPPAERERIARFLESCTRGEVRGMTLADGTGPVVEAGFCDVIESWLPGVSFRLYPLRGNDAPVGIMARAIPTDSPAFTGPQLAQREHRQRERLAAVLEASRGISSSLERDVILESIVTRARDLVEAPEAVLFLMEPDGQTLRPVVARVEDFLDEVMALRLRLGEGIVGWVARAGRAEMVNHAENDPRSLQVPGTPVESTSLLVAPLVIKDQVAGVLALSRFGDEGFEPDDLELATILAAHCSVAIENARLYEDLRATVNELRTTQNQLVQSAKLNALGEMAGGVAHDFNNILTAILGRTQLLLRGAEDPELRQALTVIEQTALDGAHTVRRIQEFTRVRHDEAAESVDLNEVLVQVVELTRSSWQAQAKVRGVLIQVDMDLRALRPVLGSAPELREVFTNLLLNAVDAMPKGGRIRIESADSGDRVLARVVDTGVGMDEETRARVFDPFFTTKAEKGTGLGLSVAYGILRRHHADIEVESEPGRGTAFTLSFPPASVHPVKGRSPQAPPAVGAQTVLCVDDEVPVLEVLAELLEALGQKVESALGGKAGIDAARRTRPQLVFTDLGMPEVNGWEVARAVKEQDPDALVVLVTGWGVQIEADAARLRGVDLILPKPYTVEEVQRALATAVELGRRDRAA
jgi:signal transduction histidine kinase/ActR/RegA family two-component response regulator